MTAAIGVAMHSAWVMAVTMSGALSAPVVVDRRRIDLVEAGLPQQAYHASVEAGLNLAETVGLLEKWSASARRAAARGLASARAVAHAAGADLQGCGICAVPKPLPPLESVLRSHTLLHAAEGQLALDAVADAAAELFLPVIYVATTELPELVKTAAAGLRKAAGPPWAADHKNAAGAAMTALTTIG